MARILNSFKVSSGNKLLDYRLGESLNLDGVKAFFQKKYQVKKLWNGNRHILGILYRDGYIHFLKLSTSEGISVVTKNEYNWNNYFNGHCLDTGFCVPGNYESGLYERKYFYLITDYFGDDLLCEMDAQNNHLISYINKIIQLSQVIQTLPASNFARIADGLDYKTRFLNKAKTWFEDIPANICGEFNVGELWKIVENGTDKLESSPRHGDFAPWHMIKLSNGKLGLIDGEHALPDGVENYDICYFIQRVFSVLKNPRIAKNIYSVLEGKGYKASKLKAVLAARAIGGFLDESLAPSPDYSFAGNFQNWIMNL